MPFFLAGSIDHFGAGLENYGEWNQGVVIDGSGVYITRNVDYEGKFELKNNKAWENGINGLVVHKTTHENVTVEVFYNTVFDNGQTDKATEGRHDAGGLTINSGSSPNETVLTLKNNKVTSSIDSDVTY